MPLTSQSGFGRPDDTDMFRRVVCSDGLSNNAVKRMFMALKNFIVMIVGRVTAF